MPLERAPCLLGKDTNIDEADYLRPPILASRAPPYNEVLNWIQFFHAGDWFGAYVDPGSIHIDFTTLSKGEGDL